MGQRTFGAESDTGRKRQRRRPAQEPHLLRDSGGGRFRKEEEKETTRINHMRFDQIVVANPETLAVGCPLCMTMMEDAVKSRSLPENCAFRDLSELIAAEAA